MASERSSISGPFRIHIIDSRMEYCKMIWLSIGIGLSHLMIGSTNMMIMFYSVTSGDYHASLCCAGYHLFMAEAILSLNYANGWSNRMTPKHKRFTHAVLQICAVTCVIIGVALIIYNTGGNMNVLLTAHCLTGTLALVLASVNVLLGMVVLFKRRCKVVHMSFGIPTFLLSTICLGSGLVEPVFISWTGSLVTSVLIGFVIFYMLFIFVFAFIKCMIECR